VNCPLSPVTRSASNPRPSPAPGERPPIRSSDTSCEHAAPASDAHCRPMGPHGRCTCSYRCRHCSTRKPTSRPFIAYGRLTRRLSAATLVARAVPPAGTADDKPELATRPSRGVPHPDHPVQPDGWAGLNIDPMQRHLNQPRCIGLRVQDVADQHGPADARMVSTASRHNERRTNVAAEGRREDHGQRLACGDPPAVVTRCLNSSESSSG